MYLFLFLDTILQIHGVIYRHVRSDESQVCYQNYQPLSKLANKTLFVSPLNHNTVQCIGLAHKAYKYK